MKKKAIIIVIIVVVIIVLAVSSWIIYKKFFKSNTDIGDDNLGEDGGEPLPPATYGGGGGYASASFPIAKGMSGPQVIAVQDSINKKCNAGLTTDGKFGPKTETALKSCYGVTSVSQALFSQMGSQCPPGMKPDPRYGCVDAYKPTPAPTGLQKGNSVFAKTKDLVLFSTPSGNSSFGRIPNNFDLSKSIGLYETVSTEGFSKVYVMVNYITNSGFIGKAPVWAYVYTSLIRK